LRASILRLEPRIVLPALLAIALVARVVFLIGALGLDAPLRGDEINYQDHAANLAQGKGFISDIGEPTAARPPVLPLVLGGLYRLFGVHVAVGRALEILLGVAVVGLVYLVAGRLFTPGVALLAALLSAINPYLIFMSSYLLTENLYTVLVLLIVLVLQRGAAHGFAGWREVAISGLLLGVASLTRPNAVLLAGVVVPLILLTGKASMRGRIGKSVVLVFAVILAIIPWTLRNHAKLGEWVVFTTHGGVTFYQSNNRLVCEEPAMYGGVAPREMLPGWEAIHAAGEIGGDREAWRLAKGFLRENPRLIPKLVTHKFLRFWRLRSHAPTSGVKGGWWWNKGKLLGRMASSIDVGIIYAIVVIPGFLLGLVVTARDWRRLILLYGMIAAHVVLALVFYGSLRARMPIEPVIAILGSAGLVYLAVRLRRRRSGRPSALAIPLRDARDGGGCPASSAEPD
jgi:hypothetical protein